MPHEEDVGDLWLQVKRRILKRINIHRKAFLKLKLEEFYIAGGALMPPEPNDYDLFPVGEKDLDKLFSLKRNPYTGELTNFTGELTWETPNALTISSDGIKIQLCKFWNESLIKTVERFDFTHCKIGAKITRINDKNRTWFDVSDVYISKDFLRFRILGYSEYTGMQGDSYPLSSLLRIQKYIKKGYIRSSYDVIFKILESFLERGYKNEEDFKNQLKGIDIGVDEAEQLDANSESLKHIYYLLTGNVLTNNDVFIRDGDMLIGEKKLSNNIGNIMAVDEL